MCGSELEPLAVSSTAHRVYKQFNKLNDLYKVQHTVTSLEITRLKQFVQISKRLFEGKHFTFIHQSWTKAIRS